MTTVLPEGDFEWSFLICPDCSGDGYHERAAPCWDDPYYTVNEKCQTCGGAGEVLCERHEGQLTLEEIEQIDDENDVPFEHEDWRGNELI